MPTVRKLSKCPLVNILREKNHLPGFQPMTFYLASPYQGITFLTEIRIFLIKDFDPMGGKHSSET